MEKIPFQLLCTQAWRASITHKLAWIFGCIIAGASALNIRLSQDIPNITTSDTLQTVLQTKSPREWLVFLLILIVLFLVRIFGNSNLVASLASLADKANLYNYPRTLRAVWNNFFRVLLLEGLLLIFLSVVIGIISFPLIIAVSNNFGAIRLLGALGLLTFIPIACIVFFIRQYAIFYLLFSFPLTLRGSLETSSALFLRSVVPSLLFGLFSLGITLFFALGLNILIASALALVQILSLPLTESAIAFALSFILLAWFTIFQQALWIAFFKNIASTPDAKQTTKKTEEVPSDNIPETPPVQ
ncbi:MAG TPA: hypothetical protein VJH89_01980 [Patescibacteria group bacterium]|nr:hypothetical protein [Patescibacteria group bacterium]